MLISEEHKFIFGENGKCGSSSIRKSLFPFSYMYGKEKYNRHIPFHFVKDEFNFVDYFVFCMVRNPWDMVVSKYFFHKGVRPTIRYKWIDANRLARDLSFGEWVKRREHLFLAYNTVRRKDLPKYDDVRTVETYLEMITVDGKVVTDELFNFAFFDLFYEKMEERLGKKLRKFHLNKSERGDYRQYYDDESREIVEKHYNWAISAFNFKFDDPQSGVPLVTF